MNSSLDTKLVRLKQTQDKALEHLEILESLETQVWQRIEEKKAQTPRFLIWMQHPFVFQTYIKPIVSASLMGFALGVITPAVLLPTSPNFAQEILHFEIFKPQITPIRFITGRR